MRGEWGMMGGKHSKWTYQQKFQSPWSKLIPRKTANNSKISRIHSHWNWIEQYENYFKMSTLEILEDIKEGRTPKQQEIMKQKQAGRNQEQVYVKMNKLGTGSEKSSNWSKDISRGQDQPWTGCTQESISDLGSNSGVVTWMWHINKEVETGKRHGGQSFQQMGFQKEGIEGIGEKLFSKKKKKAQKILQLKKDTNPQMRSTS